MEGVAVRPAKVSMCAWKFAIGRCCVRNGECSRTRVVHMCTQLQLKHCTTHHKQYITIPADVRARGVLVLLPAAPPAAPTAAVVAATAAAAAVTAATAVAAAA